MDPFPERDQLVSLFECEPVLMDPELSWRFNTMDFAYRRGDDAVDVTIEASYGEMTVRWLDRGLERAYLVVKGIAGLAVESDRGREALVATFGPGDGRPPLRLQVRPHVHILWGE
jgi:hypothetical protein